MAHIVAVAVSGWLLFGLFGLIMQVVEWARVSYEEGEWQCVKPWELIGVSILLVAGGAFTLFCIIFPAEDRLDIPGFYDPADWEEDQATSDN